MNHLNDFVGKAIPDLVMTEETYWQPADLLPEMGKPDSFERIAELQEASKELSDDLLVVLIGDMITEEALPTYASWISQCDGFDRSGEPRNHWGDWLRKWISEENRHGDVLNRYLYLTGRVNMREVEVTIQNLLSDGGDTATGIDPYKSFAYTSFQEIATQISHKNVALEARRTGNDILGRLCSFIAGDESRHAKAYMLFFKNVLEVDPDEAILAFQAMMKSKITMPAMYMRERGKKIGGTFKAFADVAERTKIYTAFHYAEILARINKYWDIEHVTGLSDKAEAAQEYLCSLPERYKKLAEHRYRKTKEREEYSFSWLEMPESDSLPVLSGA